jgi:hypothetical protein
LAQAEQKPLMQKELMQGFVAEQAWPGMAASTVQYVKQESNNRNWNIVGSGARILKISNYYKYV